MRLVATFRGISLLVAASTAVVLPVSAFVAPQSTVSVSSARILSTPPSSSSFNLPKATRYSTSTQLQYSSLPTLTAYFSAARPILTRLLALFLASFWAAQKLGKRSVRRVEAQCPLLFRSNTSTPLKGFYAWFLGLFGRRPIITISNNQTLVEQINQLEFVQTLAYSNAGLLNTADGNRHAYLRRLIGQAFSPSAMRGAVPVLQQLAEETLESVVLDPTKTIPHFASIKVQDASLHYILDAIQCQWLGISLHRQDRPVTREILKTYTITTTSTTPKLSLPWRRNPSRKAELYLKNRLENLIDVKKRRPDESTLSYLLKAMEFTDYAAQSLTDAEVRDNTLTLIQAGASSSASFLTTAIQWLGQHPEAYQKLVQEQRQRQDDYNLKYDTLDPEQSPYLDAVVQETLRLGSYTLPPRAPRIVTEDIVLDNNNHNGQPRIIPTGWLVQCEESTPMDDKNDDDDEQQFRPERWLDDNAETPAPSPAFGVGPRACLGKDLALLQIKVFLAVLARRIDSFRVTCDADRINRVSQNSAPLKKTTRSNGGKFTTTATSTWLMEALETSPSSFA